MPWNHRIGDAWTRISDRVSRRAEDRDLDAELQFHIDMQTEENLRRGMSPEEARRQAVIAFGGVEGHREASRDLRRLRPLEDFLADARFGLRHFRRTPFTTGTMLLVLVLGLGVNAALFSAVQSALTLPPAGVTRDAALVRIRGIQHAPRFGTAARRMRVSEVAEYAAHHELFSGIAAWSEETAALESRMPGAGLSPVQATYVNGDYFSVLGVAPALGALLRHEGSVGAATPLVAVLSQELWEREFGRAPDAVGRTLRLNGFPVEVVGIAPPEFEGADPATDPVVWLPIAARSVLEGEAADRTEVEPRIFEVVARLREGVAPSDAGPTVAAIGSRAAVEPFDREVPEPEADIAPLLRDNANAGSDGSLAQLVMLLGAVTLLILLITCTNVSGLLVGSAMARRREIAVRLSLGAGRWRVIRQLLTESVMLSLTAAVGAFLLLIALSGVLESRFADVQFTLDWRGLLFAVGIAFLAAMFAGLSPALHASRMEVGEVLKDAGASVSGPRSWLQRALVVIQVALTQPLLVGVGTVVLLVGAELVSRPSRPVDERIALLSFRTFSGSATIEGRRQEMERITEALRATAGVVAVAPDDDGYSPMEVTVPPEDRVAGVNYESPLRIRAELTSPGYLEVLQIPVVQGRGFLPVDWEKDRSTVIVGKSLARTLWGEADPLGRRLRSTDSRGEPSDYAVVGVVDDAAVDMQDDTQPRVLLAANVLSRTLIVRTSDAAAPMLPTLRTVASVAAPGLPISEATTLAAREASERSAILRLGGMATAGGLLALLLSAIGLYALVATTVAQRTREIGIRTAMGALPWQVAARFFASGVRLAAVGLAIGLPVAVLALKIFAARFETPEASTALLAALIAVGTLGIAAVATWVPARRAAGADPLEALRSD